MATSKNTLPQWKKRLTQAQLRHLREQGITSRQKLINDLVHQRRTGLRCWDCEAIASRAGVEDPRPSLTQPVEA